METLADIASPQARARQLDVATAHAARSFRDRIEGSHRTSRLIVFGSRARGTQNADSDVDVAVVLDGDGGDRWSVARSMARTAFDVLVETGILIDPVPVWETELAEPGRCANSALIQAILRDGISL